MARVVGNSLYPEWMAALSRISFQGLDGEWSARECAMHAKAGEVTTLIVEFIRVGEGSAALIQKQVAAADAPEDVKQALKALYELDAVLPAGKEAVAEVHAPDKNGSRFTVRIADVPRDPLEPVFSPLSPPPSKVDS